MHSSVLYIIDGSSLLYRSYYGVRPLHTSTGTPTHAIYGFCRTIKKITDDFNPARLIVIWDSKGPTTRHGEYQDYKATRQAAPSDLLLQKEAIIEFLSLIGVAQCAAPGHEADDLIYSLTLEQAGSPMVIVTGDKDLQQLLSPSVTIFDPFKQVVITATSFTQEKGFEPAHLLMYHALVGDSSDNIPGVAGIGSKTATTLTIRYQTLANLYENIETVTPERLRGILKTYRADADLSEKLFTLRQSPVGVDAAALDYNKQAWSSTAAFFKRYEIKPFLPQGVTTTQEEVFKTSVPAFIAHLVTTREELEKLCTLLKTAPAIAFDTETPSLQPFKDGVVGISCAISPAEGYYIPFGHTTGESQLDASLVLEALTPFLTSPQQTKIFHNAKFDRSGLAFYGLEVEGPVADTLLMACLLRVGSESIGLKALSVRYFGEEMAEYETVVKGKKSFASVPLQEAALYAAHDAVQTLRLYGLLAKKLAAHPELEKLYSTIELPLSALLWHMEKEGINLDTTKLKAIAERATAELEIIIAKINGCIQHGQQSILGAPALNLNSPQQLESLLFDQLKLPSLKKNKSGSRSTDSEVLAELSRVHPVPGLIMEYRELSKLLNTYLLPLPDDINPRTGRIHTTYTQTIAATGRLSSTNPNLQNIPVGHGVREAFVAPEGRLFISADYSQIELRILAVFTGDPALLAAFKAGEDIHINTATLLFDTQKNAVTPEQRSIGKKINFSILYGLTPFGLSKDLGISPATAKAYIEAYFAQYPRVQTWMDAIIKEAKETGYVTTLLGRRRYVPGLHERNRHLQDAERRVAINTPIQGTSADIIKMAMLNLQARLQAEQNKAHLVLQIHDELLLSVPAHEAEKTAELVKEVMESVLPQWQLPLTVSIRLGENWEKASK